MMVFPIILIALMFYWFSTSGHHTSKGVPARNSIDILRERYARGEIEYQEFEEKLKELRKEL